jgi:calmodulin
MATTLSQEELKSCRVFFNNFDRTHSGTINAWELQIALESMNQNPTSQDINILLAELQADINSQLDFQQFIRCIQLQRELEHKIDADAEQNYLQAFIAMGGSSDSSSSISCERLRKVIKEDFGLTFKIDELLEDIELQSEGHVNYKEFKQLFS